MRINIRQIKCFIAALLFAVALPVLLVCLFVAGGLLLLVPLGLIGAAFGILKFCA